MICKTSEDSDQTVHSESDPGWFQRRRGRGSIWSNFRAYSKYSEKQAYAKSVDPDLQLFFPICKFITILVGEMNNTFFSFKSNLLRLNYIIAAKWKTHGKIFYKTM